VNSPVALAETVHRRVLDSLAIASPQAIHEVDIVGIVRAVEPLAPTEVVNDVVGLVSARVEGLGPIDSLLADPEVSEIMVNGPGPVWVERSGSVRQTAVCLDVEAVGLLIERILAPLGRRADQRSPFVD